MKKLFIIILLLCIFILGSAWVVSDEIYNRVQCRINFIKLKFDSLEEITVWINSNIKYKADSELTPYWQYPSETLQRKTGDCEDQAILFQYLAKKKLNKDVCLLWIYSKDFRYNHMVIIYENKIYDPTLGKRYRLIDYANSFYVYKLINNNDVNKYIKKSRNK